MLSPRPRFGGGRIMESQATGIIILTQPGRSSQEIQPTSTMASCQDLQLHDHQTLPALGTERTCHDDSRTAVNDCSLVTPETTGNPAAADVQCQGHGCKSDPSVEEPSLQTTGKFRGGIPVKRNNVTEGEGKSEHCCQHSPHNSIQHQGTMNSHVEYKSGDEKSQIEDAFIDGEEIRLEGRTDEQHCPHPGKDSEQRNRPKENLYTEKVERLLSVLKDLGIHAKVKQYVRGDTVTSKRNEVGPTNGECQSHVTLSPRSIYLNYQAANTVAMKSAPQVYQLEGKITSNNMLYCKNLFLKDRKNNYYLVIAEESAHVDLKLLKQQLNAVRSLSFADATATEEILGEKSGGINPFVAMRETARDVRLILHQSLLEARQSRTLLAFHPLDSKLQIDITVDDLIVFLRHHDKHLEVLSDDNVSDTHKYPIQESGGKKKISVPPGVTKSEGKSRPRSSGLQPVKGMSDEIREPIGSAEHEVKNVERSDNPGTISGDNTGSITTDQGEACCNNYQEGSLDKVEEIAGESTVKDRTELQVINSGHRKNIFNPTLNVNPISKIYCRKGKLKSFLKKINNGTQRCDSELSDGVSSDDRIKETPDGTFTAGSVPDLPTPKPDIDEKLSDCKYVTRESRNELQTAPCGDSRFENGVATESSQKDSSILPEITEFYDRLSNLKIEYRDLHLRDSTSTDIGPSLGCKCFFLKDRKQNYFLVITHEYYELDHGRLKKALKPRKKLDQAEAADILDALGVQPFRVTPFSCTTDRARDRAVMVFMTEKIQPPEVVLCIQHPFADCRRLVMRSGELQRYLSGFTQSIGIVEEKKWLEKFNWIFTRFSEQSARPSGDASHAAMPVRDPREKALGDAATGESGLHRQFRENREHDTNYSFMNGLKQISRALLEYVGINLQRECLDDFGDIYEEGSSVDQVSEGSRPNRESDSVCGITYEKESSLTCFQDANILLPTNTGAQENTDAAGNSSAEEGDLKEKDFGSAYGHSLYLSNDSIKDDTPFVVEDIFRHLQDTDIEFICTKRGESSDHESAQQLQEQSNHTIKFSASVDKSSGNSSKQVEPLRDDVLQDAMNDDKGLLSQKFSVLPDRTQVVVERQDSGEKENVDNVETCTTLYLCDADDNHYLVVGGESDFITIKRFRRRFHLPGRLREFRLDVSNLTTTPFSVILAIERMSCGQNPPPKINVVLFSSLYIDPETICDFQLTRDGLTIRMTSSEVENYVKSAGMTLWYMP